MAIESRKNQAIFMHIAVWSFLFFLPHLFILSDNRIAKPAFFPSSFFIITNLYHIALFYLNAFATETGITAVSGIIAVFIMLIQLYKSKILTAINCATDELGNYKTFPSSIFQYSKVFSPFPFLS